MKSSTKTYAALVLAALLWVVETWLLVDAAGYTFTPQVAVIPTATAALAFMPLILKDVSKGLGVTISLACLFLAGFIFSGVLERTGGQLDSKIASAQNVSEGRRLLEAELSRERARLADAEDNMKAESKRKGCGPTCKTWQSAAAGIQVRIDALVSELATQAPAPVADPVSARFAAMTGSVVSVETVRNWRPTFQPLGFIVAIWALFGFAFRETQTVSAAVSTVSGNTGGGGKRIHLVNGVTLEDHEIAAIKRALNGKAALTNDEIASRMGVTKGEASKRVVIAQGMGIVSKVRTGKHVAISLAHAH
jgi:hypothetical protein